jgi:hypothetical protein
MLVADPIGAEEVIARARRSLTGPEPRPVPAPGRVAAPRPFPHPLDELAAAADAFRSAAARLRLTNLLGLFARFWLVVWGLSLILGLFGALMPLLIFGMGVLLILAGFWAIWQTVTFWFWYGMWGMRR